MVTSHTCACAELANDTVPSGGNILETYGSTEQPPAPRLSDGGCATLLVRASADGLGGGSSDGSNPNVHPAPKSAAGASVSRAAAGSPSARQQHHTVSVPTVKCLPRGWSNVYLPQSEQPLRLLPRTLGTPPASSRDTGRPARCRQHPLVVLADTPACRSTSHTAGGRYSQPNGECRYPNRATANSS